MNFIENESAQKLRGGYYTPLDIARFLARWCLEISPEQMLEPGCGDGNFLEAVARCEPKSLKKLMAFELEPEEAKKARARARALAPGKMKVHNEDFLEWYLLGSGIHGTVDAVVGNPPFIRYQYLSQPAQALAEKLFKFLRLPFTRHTNAWVPFVLASLHMLRPGGRLAMVVPSELLHVLHTQSLRTYLIERCQSVLVIEPKEIWFDDTLQGVVLLLAEKKQSASQPCRLGILATSGRQFLERTVESLSAQVDWMDASGLAGKWTRTLLTASERRLLEELEHHADVHRFEEIAQVDVGIVTGANKFFLVSDEVVERHSLQRWAHPMFGRSEHVRGVIYDERAHAENSQQGFPTNFLWFGDTRLEELPKPVQQYIAQGEAEGLPRRYKCRIRQPWYNVPSVWPAPVAMLKRSHDFPRLVLNAAKAFTTDTAYRIRPAEGISSERLVFGFVNSLTMLCAELQGRFYGGGVLELVPSEIEKVLVPLGYKGTPPLRRLDEAFREDVPVETILHDQDKQVLGALGVSPARQGVLFGAWDRLRRRRQRDTAGDVSDWETDDGQALRPASGA
ncbi:MAG: N-6 DNA methylase [Myxococcaceae bacterium]|nr:N-6 DNA methylase [Myxococcaceae bacterium]